MGVLRGSPYRRGGGGALVTSVIMGVLRGSPYRRGEEAGGEHDHNVQRKRGGPVDLTQCSPPFLHPPPQQRQRVAPL